MLSLSGHDFEKFDELVCSYPFNEKLPFPICPITGGIEVAIGWEDFDGRLNGGYYHVEEEGEGPF